MSRCINCGRGVHRALRDNVPGERCAKCDVTVPSKQSIRLVYPRVINMVTLLVGNCSFAERVVAKSAAGEELYRNIVREAWRRRKVKRWMKKIS